MLAEAKEESERLLNEANQESTRLASEQEVVRRAERQAEEILKDAEARNREIRYGARTTRTRCLVPWKRASDSLSAVQKGRERLQGRTQPEE